MLCSSIVLPVRGGATIRPRWPLPIGVIRSMTRPARFSEAVSRLQALLRVERRQVLEEQLVARLVRRFEVDRLDLDQREVPLAFLRRPDLARDRVAGLQIELADLRRRHVDVVGAGQVVVVGRAQEAEPVGQHLEHALREDEAALLGLRLQDLEDQLLLAHPGRAGHRHVLGDLGELLDAHVLQIGDVQARRTSTLLRSRRFGWLGFGGGGRLGGVRVIGLAGRARRPMALVVGGHERVLTDRRLPTRSTGSCRARRCCRRRSA